MKKLIAVILLTTAGCYGRLQAAETTIKEWALPCVSVACVREHPSHAAELGSQVVMGTPLKVVASLGIWNEIETPEGYRGFVIDNSIKRMTEEEIEAWRKNSRVIVTSYDQAYVYETPSATKRVSDVVNGTVLEQDFDGGCENGYYKVKLPDGRIGFISGDVVADFSQWAMEGCDKDKVLEFACSLTGTPYLWGGTSTKSMDCSGLTKISYLSQGVILPRNAPQQARIGKEVDKSDMNGMQPGDLLMFGNKATGKVDHVGLYVGDGRFVHCSGRVKINSLRVNDYDFTPIDLLGVRRLGPDDLESMKVGRHPWYFNE